MDRVHRLWVAGGLLTLFALLTLTNAAPAVAAGATFSITPTSRAGYFIFASRPGSVVSGRVRVINVSSVPGQADLFAVDATTGQTSGAVYMSQSAPRRDVGAWIKLSTPSLTLGPHQGAIVRFSVHIPVGVKDGQHLGGLVVAPVNLTKTRTANQGSHTFRINIREIAIVAVQVNVPGPLTPRVTISHVRASGRPGYQTLLIDLANSGNSLVKGNGRIMVLHDGGRVLFSRFALDTMVPRTSINFPVYVRGSRLPPGHYVARVLVRYTGRHTVYGTFPFTISGRQLRQTYGSTGAPAALTKSSATPVWAIGLAAVALVGIGIGASALFFRRRPGL